VVVIKRLFSTHSFAVWFLFIGLIIAYSFDPFMDAGRFVDTAAGMWAVVLFVTFLDFLNLLDRRREAKKNGAK